MQLYFSKAPVSEPQDLNPKIHEQDVEICQNPYEALASVTNGSVQLKTILRKTEFRNVRYLQPISKLQFYSID